MTDEVQQQNLSLDNASETALTTSDNEAVPSDAGDSTWRS